VYFTQALNAEGNADGGEWKLNGAISNLYETIPQGSRAFFQFSIDEQLLKLNKEENRENWKSVDTSFLSRDLYKIINASTKRAIERELELLNSMELDRSGTQLKAEYEKIFHEINKLSDNEFIIRVGANSGYNFMTLRWVDKLPFFQPIDNNRDYFELRKVVQKNRRRKDYRNEKNWPRTRKIVTTGIPFGFIKISIIDDGIDVDAKRVKGSLIQEEKKPRENDRKAPDYYTGTIKQGTEGIPAMVIESGKPNKVKLLIKDNEVILPLQKYFSPIEYGTFVYVRVVEFSKNVIKTVSYQKHYE
jgi:hypothetical protein